MNRYSINRLVADTDTSSIFEATARDSSHTVIIKKYKRKFFEWQSILSLAEVEALRRIVHSNVVKLLEVIRHLDDDLYLVFEKLEGNLDERYVKKGKKLTEEELKPILHQIAEGLVLIHKKGFVHSDISAHNILVGQTPPLFAIGDLGHSFNLNNFQTKGTEIGSTGVIVGTKNYRSPEILLKMNFSFPTDLFSLGLLVFQLISGKPLATGSTDLDQFCQLLNVMGYEELHEWIDGREIFSSMTSYVGKVSLGPKKLSLVVPEFTSQNLLELLDEMLRFDPTERITAAGVLDHKFFYSRIEPSLSQSIEGDEFDSDEIREDGEENKDSEKILGEDKQL